MKKTNKYIKIKYRNNTYQQEDFKEYALNKYHVLKKSDGNYDLLQHYYNRERCVNFSKTIYSTDTYAGALKKYKEITGRNSL